MCYCQYRQSYYINMLRKDTVITLNVICALCLSFTNATGIIVEGDENGTTILPCDHKQTGVYSIVWYRTGIVDALAEYFPPSLFLINYENWKGRVNFTAPFLAGSIRIGNTWLDDEASYRCNVGAGSTTVNLMVNLTVYVKPSPPVITKLDNPVIEGYVAVGCQVHRVKPVDKIQMYWTLQDDTTEYPGTKGSTSNSGENTFTVYNNETINIERQYYGKSIVCHVKWENTIRGYDRRQLDMRYPPRSTHLTANSDKTVPENTEVSMTCGIGGGAKPLPTLSFYKMGTLSALKEYKDVGQATYQHTVQKEDNGRGFFCNASGDLTVIKTPVMSNKIQYNVTYRAGSVSVTGMNNPVTENSTVTLRCVATNGNPDVYTYKWSLGRNGEVKPLPETGSTLVYGKIQYDQAGDYICEAINMAGSKTGENTLIVHYAPNLDPDRHTQIKVFPKTGTTAMLSLYVIALPIPVTFEWSKDLAKIVDNINSDALTSNLTLINIIQRQYKKYTCKATNNIASNTFVFSVVAQQKPLPPEDVSVVYASAVSITLRWKRNFDGGFTQHFRVKYKKPGDSEFLTDPANIDDPYPKDYAQHKLNQSLTANTVYEVVVVAITAFEGKSETDSKPRTARTKDRPEINSSKLTVDRRGSDAKLTWTRPTGHYTHYVIGWCEKPGKVNCETENEGNETTSTTIGGLRDGQEYSFVMKVYDGGDLVRVSPEFSAPGGNSNSTIIAIVVPICLIVAIATAIIIGVILMHTRNRGSHNRKKEHGLDNKCDDRNVMNTMADKVEYEDPFGKETQFGTSGTADYTNAALHAKTQERHVMSKPPDTYPENPLYENTKVEVHLYEDVKEKTNSPHEPTYANTHGGAQVKHTGGEYEQLSSDASRLDPNNQSNVYQKLKVY